MTMGTGQASSPMQGFILSHFLNKKAQIYCGHRGEAYVGTIVDCVDGVATLQKDDGTTAFIACDKIESLHVTRLEPGATP